MKKILTIVLIFASLTFICSTTVFAATPGLNTNETQVLAYWKQNVEGYKIPTTALNQAELYFSTSLDMTDAQRDYILEQTDKVINIIKLEKKSTLSAFSAEHKTEIASIVFATGSTMEIQVEYNYTNNQITMTDAAGKTIFVQDATLIKSTGRSLLPLLLISGASLGIVFTGLLVFKKKTSIIRAK